MLKPICIRYTKLQMKLLKVKLHMLEFKLIFVELGVITDSAILKLSIAHGWGVASCAA